MTRVRNVFCFGDSMVSGIGARGQSWARRLEDAYYLANDDDAPPTSHPNFYTLGVPGNTAERLQARLEADLSPRLYDRHRWKLPTLSVVSIGNNDSFVTLEHGRTPRTPMDSFVQSVGAIAAKLISHDAAHHLLYVGLTACDETKLHTRKGKTIAYDNDVLRQYEAAACDVIEQHGGATVPLLDASLQSSFASRHLVDGVHPDPTGHGWIYSQIEPVFRQAISR